MNRLGSLSIYMECWTTCLASHLKSTKEKERNMLPVKDIIQILISISSALSYIHNLENPIVHRDVKVCPLLMIEEKKRKY
jgi:serine/threonine protein kinase